MFGGAGGFGRVQEEVLQENLRTGYSGRINLTLKDAATTHPQTFDINGKKVRITIPAGVYDGQQIKLKVTEIQVSTEVRMEIYITFNIPPDPNFERIGDDLKTKVSIDLTLQF
jgi:curved DNA-binding protein